MPIDSSREPRSKDPRFELGEAFDSFEAITSRENTITPPLKFRPPKPSIAPSVTFNDIWVEEFTMILRVATMWNMKAIRDLAIYHLADRYMELCHRIEIALTYNIRIWIKPCIM